MNKETLMSKQVVVRTYDETLKDTWVKNLQIYAFPDGGKTPTSSLAECLSQGYKVVMCNQIGMALEYILEKE